MAFKETIDCFLSSVSESSYEVYKNKIFIFYNFIVTEKGISDRSYHSYLEAMKIDEIIESLNSYIIFNKIKSESVAWHYVSVVKKYFLYIDGTKGIEIQNVNLIKSFGLHEGNVNSFTYKIKKEIFNSSVLEKKDPKTEITQEEVQILILECDQQIKEIFEGEKVLEYKKYPAQYNAVTACIIIKILLFIGLKYQLIIKLRYSDLNMQQQSININGYCIRLPFNLIEQLKEYEIIRREIEGSLPNQVCETLFIRTDGKKLKSGTSFVSDRLTEFMGRGDTTGIIKYALIEMIKKGVNQSVIQDFTGNGSDIYNYCQKRVNDSKNSSVNRYLDSKLRSLEIYDLL